jgi:hypothetical protein
MVLEVWEIKAEDKYLRVVCLQMMFKVIPVVAFLRKGV